MRPGLSLREHTALTECAEINGRGALYRGCPQTMRLMSARGYATVEGDGYRISDRGLAVLRLGITRVYSPSAYKRAA